MKKLTQHLFTFGFSVFFTLIASFANANEKAKHSQVDTTTAAQQTTTAIKSTALNPNVVNINTATAAEIQDKLVGIGAKKAQAIVEYREKHGKFLSVEQITEVSGIGKATLEKNRDRIVLE